MDEEEDLHAPAPELIPGAPLERFSIDELEEMIVRYEAEIGRLRQAIAQKKEAKGAADSVFKF